MLRCLREQQSTNEGKIDAVDTSVQHLQLNEFAELRRDGAIELI